MGDEGATREVTGERGRLLWPPGIAPRLAAETLGTAMLVVFGAGSVIAALRLGDGVLDYAGLGMIALSFGLVVAIVVYAFGAVSGAHINPVVTLSLAATGRFPWRETASYILAQLLGAALGGLLLLATFGAGALDTDTGGTALGEGVSSFQGGLAEATGTFLLMFTIMAMAVDGRTPSAWAGWMIGLSVTCSILVVGPLTGSAINPARTFGPYVATAIGGGSPPWEQFAVYVLGPTVGALAAAFAYDLIARPSAAGEEVVDGTA